MREDAVELLARADPVRPADLEPRVEAARSRAVLGAIMAARVPQARPRRARRAFRVAIPVGGLALVGAIVLASLLPGRAPNALAIERTARYIDLRIEEPAAGANRMNEELRERGIDIEVQMVPVPQSEVGHWVGGRAVWPGVAEKTDQHRLGDGRIRKLNRAARLQELRWVRGDPELVRVPSRFEGHLLLYAGREARPGERPWVDGNPPGAF
jgi:hypothetical protein